MVIDRRILKPLPWGLPVKITSFQCLLHFSVPSMVCLYIAWSMKAEGGVSDPALVIHDVGHDNWQRYCRVFGGKKMLLLLHEMPWVTVSTKVGSNKSFESFVIIFIVLKWDGSFMNDSNDSEDFIEDANSETMRSWLFQRFINPSMHAVCPMIFRRNVRKSNLAHHKWEELINIMYSSY